MVTDYQKSLSSAVQPPNGNLNAAPGLSTTQQIQQLVQLTSAQPTANLLNLLQQAQAQVQQQQQQQKTFQQQVPLPSNTTITPVSSRQQNYLPAPGAVNQQKSVTSYSPAKPSQSKQSLAAQVRRNTANLPKSPPILPPAIPSQANLKASTASNYTAAKLTPNIAPSHYGGIANVKTANVPPPLPNVSISKVQVATGDNGGASKAGSNVAVPVNASIKPDALSPLKPTLSSAPSIVASPPKVNAPVSPRTKQTPRKNSNPIKTTPQSTIGGVVVSTTSATATVAAAATTTNSVASKAVTTAATPPLKTVAVAQNINLVSKPITTAPVSKPVTTAASTVSTIPTTQQQQQPGEKSRKLLASTPPKSTVVTQVTAIEKPTATKPQPVATPLAVNATSTKSNSVVDADSTKKTSAQTAKLSPVTPKATVTTAKPKAAATPKAVVTTTTPKAEKKTSAGESTHAK